MIKKLLLPLVLLLFSPALFAKDSGLQTLDQFLSKQRLTRSQVECRNETIEPVLNTLNQKWDDDRKVCEVWIKETVTPAAQLKFPDGSPVYKTAREWTEEWSEPVTRQTTKSEEFVVKDEQKTTQTTTHSRIKRYVPKTSP